MPPPDEVLLRRFGVVRAVGGAAWFVTVVVLFFFFGTQVWPLALGVPVLAVVTTAYFARSTKSPRLTVVVSLVADALVLGGAIAFLGGTGSGMIMLYTIVVVSAATLLGPGAGAAFTALTIALGVAQLGMEQLGVTPVLLHRPQFQDRLPVFLVSLAGLASVGYLSATYAGRLHELIAEAGHQAEALRRSGRRRRSFLARATVDVREPLKHLEALADSLDERTGALDETQRRHLAAELRMGVTVLDAELRQLADVTDLDEQGERRPQPVALSSVVNDCLVALGSRLDSYVVEVDVSERLKVVGDRRGARRIVFNLLENVVEHTPTGTRVTVRAVAGPGATVLAVTDDGPGIPEDVARRMFEPPEHRVRLSDRASRGTGKVGLPLVAELANSMGAQVRYEPAPEGGARFLVKFRAAPRAAPAGGEDEVQIIGDAGATSPQK